MPLFLFFEIVFQASQDPFFSLFACGLEAWSVLTPAPGDPVPNSVTSAGCRGASPASSEKPLCLFSGATTSQKMSSPVGAVVFSREGLKCDERKPSFEDGQIHVFQGQGKSSDAVVSPRVSSCTV